MKARLEVAEFHRFQELCRELARVSEQIWCLDLEAIEMAVHFSLLPAIDLHSAQGQHARRYSKE